MVRWFVGIVIGCYVGMVCLLNFPVIQQSITSWTENELKKLFGTELTIGHIEIGLLNRIVVHNLSIDDLEGENMLRVTRLSAQFDLLPLLKGRISISHVQLFGFHANLRRVTPDSPPNFQFIADALASKDSVKKESNLNLRINSLLLRRGRLAYDVESEPLTPGRFNAHHIYVKDFLATLSLKAFQKDSINLAIKRMSCEEEQSGFALKRLNLKVVGNTQGLKVENFAIELPHTHLRMDTLTMSYDSLGSFQHFADEVHFTFRMLPSELTLKDLSPFIPAFAAFDDSLSLEVVAEGPLNQLNCSQLRVDAAEHFSLRGNFSFQDFSIPEDAYVYGRLSRLYADPRGVAFFVKNLKGDDAVVPPVLQHMGTIAFTGEVSGYFNDLVMYGRVRTDVGDLQADVKLSSSSQEESYFAYSGSMKSKEWELGKMLGNKKLGQISFNLGVNGRHTSQRYPVIMMKGQVDCIDFNSYRYENILLDGEYVNGGFHGKAALDDPHGALTLQGDINTSDKIPTFNFMAKLSHVQLNELKITENYPDTDLSLTLRADFTGGSIDEMNGEINIDSLQFISPEKNYFMRNFKVSSEISDVNHKQLKVQSHFLRASIEGDYSYRTLPTSVQRVLHRYLPSLLPAPAEKKGTSIVAENNFGFDICITDTELFSTLFHFPLSLYAQSTLKGYVNDRAQRLHIEGYFPRLRYKDKFYESAMIRCENPGDRFHTYLRMNQVKPSGTVNVSLEALARRDSIKACLHWGNSEEATYSGSIDALAHFSLSKPLSHDLTKRVHHSKSGQRPSLKTEIDIHPTQVILNDTIWNIHPSHIAVDSGKVYVRQFGVSHNDRHLLVDGIVSKQPTDTLRLTLKQINIGYVFDIADLGINFQGEATGPAVATSVLDKPVMHTDLHVRNLGINDAVLGDAEIHGEWHHEVKGIYLDAHIEEGEIARSHVHGFIYPIKPTSALDLQIEAQRTNLKFIHYYMTSLTPDFRGRATGNVHLYGKFKALTLDGQVDADASMKLEVLNTTYYLKDSIHLVPDGLIFKQNRVFDSQEHEGSMYGRVTYNHFKDINFNFNFQLQNMLVLNTRESHDYPFYGTVYGTGNALLRGNPQEGINIDLALTTNRNSVFTYIKDNVGSAVSNQFIKFVDKTPRRAVQDSIPLSDYDMARQVAQREEEEESETDIRLNLVLDATPDATMRIIMDPAAGDYIGGRGQGNLRAEFYNKGDFKLFGSYNLNQGMYKFSLQEVIRKDFTINQGSSITFNGDPADATLNMQALYTVNSASLTDLLPSTATASDYVGQTNVKVNCLMDITGQLTAPEIKMGLELPNERDEVQALVRNYIPTDEQMNMQMLYLLSIGKFYTPEYVDVQQNSNMMSSMLSSTLSGQLNNALSHIINNNDWNVGTNLSTGQKGWTDVEFEGVLSGQLLNNRLLINGNFGYRDNPLANTNFVGDFEAEWLVTRSGEIRLKAYNETNDRYYTRTNLTTQGVGIIFRKDFNRWRELMFWNRWRLKRLKIKQALPQAAAKRGDK